MRWQVKKGIPIPELRPDGYLPEGLFFATEAEVETAFGTVNVRRQTLMRRLSYFLQLARAAGTLHFFVNGSFVTAKPEPGDIDAVCLVPAGWSAETNVATRELDEVALTRLPSELFIAYSESRWEQWVEFFSHTREPDGRRKGLVEVQL
jgi:hypothetical protein